MIGRASDKINSSRLYYLQYETDLTQFYKVSAQDGVAVGIDQDGEIWVLCGRQRSSCNVGLPAAPDKNKVD